MSTKMPRIPGKRTADEIKSGLIPPLWMWIRLFLYLFIAGILALLNLTDYVKILLVLAIISFLSGILANVCKALANGTKRFLSTKQKHRLSSLSKK